MEIKVSSTEMETSESQHQYVGFWPRFGASIIDTILVIMITYPLLYSIYGNEFWETDQFIMGMPDFLISWVFPIAATVLFWVYKSATPGKMALKAKVVDAKTGNAPSTQQSIIRYVGYYISLLPLGLGYFWVAFDAKKQGWHDKIAGTVIVRR